MTSRDAAADGSTVPQFKKFVSEAELDEQRKKRQEDWERVRQPNQPIEAPEETFDPRTLYDRLQQQKDLKQAEFDESHKLKNQVRGLDRDEADFLDFVSDRQGEIEKERQKEEIEVIEEYRKSLASHTVTVESTLAHLKTPAVSDKHSKLPPKQKSQAAMLAGAVKRKRSGDSSSAVSETKKNKETPDKDAGDDSRRDAETAPPEDTSKLPTNDDGNEDVAAPEKRASPPVVTKEPIAMVTDGSCAVSKVIGVLPGVGVYTDSDDSDSSSSDSEIDTDTFRHETAVKQVHDARHH